MPCARIRFAPKCIRPPSVLTKRNFISRRGAGEERGEKERYRETKIYSDTRRGCNLSARWAMSAVRVSLARAVKKKKEKEKKKKTKKQKRTGDCKFIRLPPSEINVLKIAFNLPRDIVSINITLRNAIMSGEIRDDNVYSVPRDNREDNSPS
ncbi:hypothetical protein PUN28_015348 [Cardiocondyla obscurior]|uniref:Uncharacterized protein n=1 Tax=Cardiocondyla obscurior TaxID=286306 RepID=A0AAW2EWY0_9HYME